MDEINIDDFTKLDLRVAKITSAEAVEEADKLIKINLNIGDFGEKTVFAGIKKFYNPQDLIGKLVVCVNNLKNREMKFGTSEGMILASSNDEGVFLIGSDSGAKPGDKVT
jgi:methionyl-tRNA synthetase|tara:strand:- start:3088 stop:3417 length:330 start_codon:yes stop_codon:yes gene_type:complete